MALGLNFLLNFLRLLTVIFLLLKYNISLHQSLPFAYALINLSYLLVLYIVFRQFQENMVKKLNIIFDHQQSVINVFKLMCLLILIMKGALPLLMLFNYDLFIHCLLISTKTVLNMLGYTSTIYHHRLGSMTGGFRLEKPCLGIGLMLVFSTFIFLTGSQFYKNLLFTLAGLMVINLLNILRLVFLYIYIAHIHHRMTSMAIHDIYNVIIYLFVFLMWLGWIEKFSGSKQWLG